MTIHLQSRSADARKDAARDAQCRAWQLIGYRLNNEINALYPQRRAAEYRRDTIDRRMATVCDDLAEVRNEIMRLGTPAHFLRRPGIGSVVAGGLLYARLKFREGALRTQLATLEARRLDAVRAINAIQSDIDSKGRAQRDIGRQMDAHGCRR